MTRVRKTGREHDLKTWPEPFAAVVQGFKGFEVRKDDRGFAVGDMLKLREWDPSPAPWGPRGHTGKWIRCTVTYIARGWGLPSDMVVMSLGDFEALGTDTPSHPISTPTPDANG